MLDMTVGQFKAAVIAHNIDRLKDVFAAEDSAPDARALGHVVSAIRRFDPIYQDAASTIVAEILKVTPAELHRPAATPVRRGDQLRDIPRGVFVTPTSNPNSHDYGTSPLLVTGDHRGLRPDGTFGNNFPAARFRATRASTPDEVASWIRGTLDRLCGAAVENDASLRRVLDLIVARSPAADESESAKEARNQALMVGCQTPHMQGLLAAIGRMDLVTNADTAPGRVIELRRSGPILNRCALVLGWTSDNYFTLVDQTGSIHASSWQANWTFANQTTARSFLEGLVAKWAAALPKPAEAAAPKKGKAPKVEKAAPKKSSRKKAATLAGAGS